ncbi:hypothetical protein L210DRAFT_877735 [Boletus edulis BED1]|uniref:2OGFeDO JBP1/TET oxygenase domain-containing protein n=1 Tax=Boletus edulis BED1 TaxID=1328754 RepID=A0AAD4G749_BOLED|nr:hypothetical protein L210DRAFT_877735 [Boletus edulis BED1]
MLPEEVLAGWLELTEPAVITDKADSIPLWYLPGAVSMPNQKLLWEKMSLLQKPLLNSIQGQHWRTSADLFKMDATIKGAINLSPSWFQQGRHAGCSKPEVSSLLKGSQTDQSARGWIEANTDQLAILSAAMAIMHPDMYVTGREALVQLGKWAAEEGQTDMLDVLKIWPTVFSVGSIVANRASWLHWDLNGRPQWFDFLVTCGAYDDLDLVLPCLGLQLWYNPGTGVAMSGHLLQHGVSSISGDRGVISLYMWDNVHEHRGIVRCHYMEVHKVAGCT